MGQKGRVGRERPPPFRPGGAGLLGQESPEGARRLDWRTREEDSAGPLGMLVAGPGRWLKADKLMKPQLQILSGPGDWLDGQDESRLRPRF